MARPPGEPRRSWAHASVVGAQERLGKATIQMLSVKGTGPGTGPLNLNRATRTWGQDRGGLSSFRTASMYRESRSASHLNPKFPNPPVKGAEPHAEGTCGLLLIGKAAQHALDMLLLEAADRLGQLIDQAGVFRVRREIGRQ